MDTNIDLNEKVEVIDHFSQQLINSGYAVEQIRDIVQSALKGINRKLERRKDQEFKFRSGESTLQERMNKRLLESTSWFREEERESQDIEAEKTIYKEENSAWRNRKSIKTGGRSNKKKLIEINGKEKVMSVIFVPHTTNSELAKNMRSKLEAIENVSNIKVKIVERTGDKVIELLHKSDSWSDIDCERPDCLICSSCGEKERKGMCKKRNIIYETYCLICDTPINPQVAAEEEENMLKHSKEWMKRVTY